MLHKGGGVRRHPKPQGLGPEGLGLSAPILRARVVSAPLPMCCSTALGGHRWEVTGWELWNKIIEAFFLKFILNVFFEEIAVAGAQLLGHNLDSPRKSSCNVSSGWRKVWKQLHSSFASFPAPTPPTPLSDTKHCCRGGSNPQHPLRGAVHRHLLLLFITLLHFLLQSCSRGERGLPSSP